jgi:hypothetical protein
MMNEKTQQIQLSKVEYEGRMVWFKSLLQMPTDEEMNAWVPRYREKACQRGPRNPLLIDVERDGLRGASRLNEYEQPLATPVFMRFCARENRCAEMR